MLVNIWGEFSMKICLIWVCLELNVCIVIEYNCDLFIVVLIFIDVYSRFNGLGLECINFGFGLLLLLVVVIIVCRLSVMNCLLR